MGSRRLTDPKPFSYPPTPHQRRHGPTGYSNYRSYNNWLRDEFTFRCVYCLRRETWLTLPADWQIDHFVPKSIHPKGALDYDNLVYACSSCNHTKSVHLAPDPCSTAYGQCVSVEENGQIAALNHAGKDLVETLGLDDEDYTELRRTVLQLATELPKNGKGYRKLFGYPTNMPDLSKEPPPPGGNKRPNGVKESCFEKAKAGTLPTFY